MQLITTHALKEWAVAVDALEQGKTIMLLRKGGIREENNRFQVTCDRVLLYPTYEHQQPHLLKPEYADRVQPVQPGWHPETIPIGSWAEITDIFQVTEEQTIADLLPFHIWNEIFVSDRLKWKPRQPLFILLLRTYRLSQPQIIPYSSEYGGCKSWIDLIEPISIRDKVPVLKDDEYTQYSDDIRRIVSMLPKKVFTIKPS
ncbi:MAG: DUF1802 family protein [Aphanothece sp. CMT-3BRIN-NPC111]|jgi:hypothetical protein|nr:DUF1802 family protein [Aphanothece sp. CMT-3BRIN-NPC111]